MNNVISALVLIAFIVVAVVVGFLILVYTPIQTYSIFNGSNGSSKDLIEDYLPCNKTGRVFSPGPVGFAISTGYRAPGEKIGVYLYVYKPLMYRFNGTYIVGLYGISGDRKLLIEHENISASGLPVNIQWNIPLQDYYHNYTIIAIAVENNMVVDCIAGYITVPEQEVKARLLLDKSTYQVGETVSFTIVNMGKTPISFGRSYEVYYWNGSSWVLDKNLTPSTWTLELIVLNANQSFTQHISLEKAVPGIYKVVKMVHGEGTNISLTLEAEFIVADS